MTVEAWVRVVETKMTCDPAAMCGRAFCGTVSVSKASSENDQRGSLETLPERGSMGL